MAAFDISRKATNPLNHYTDVLMQQGRVQTDADWNEAVWIENEDQRRTQVDIIGRYGSPDNGFKIQKKPNLTEGYVDFTILAGTIYLGGLRLEMDEVETFRLQKDWLQKDDSAFKIPSLNPGEETFDLVYLEAWQHPVSAVEDSSLFEVALGGPDTTTRLRNMRRVSLFRNTGSAECPISWKKLRTEWEDAQFGRINQDNELLTNSTLNVSFIDAGPADDLCSPSVAGGYLGAENQAIRVQITDFYPAINAGLFTWGFDNAAPLYRVTLSSGGTIVHMVTEPKDQYHWPMAGQVVEFLPWSAVLPNNEKIAEHSGLLRKVALSFSPDNDSSFVLESAVPANFGNTWEQRADAAALADGDKYFYMRVWNRGSDRQSPDAIPFMSGMPVKLGNTGLQVTFSGTELASFNTILDNFWVIAARPGTTQSKSIVPWELTTTGIGPHGVRRFYAPLAIIRWTNINGVISPEVIHDCRKRFRPLTEQECCCTFTVGDGLNSKGDFNSIQEAIDNLPPDGGNICVLAGIHDANVVIDYRRKIKISGCGDQTIVRSLSDKNSPIFLIRHSQQIQLDHLILFTLDGTAIDVVDELNLVTPSEEITIRENRILAFTHAIRVHCLQNLNGDNNIKILYNQIGMFDKPGGDVAVFTLADDVLIEQNRLVVIPAPEKDPNDPQPQPPGEPFDPCADPQKMYASNPKFRQLVLLALRYLAVYVPKGIPKQWETLGGIQIGGGSERVQLIRNEIIGGKGNGITLGHSLKQSLPHESQQKLFSTSIYDLTIEKNLIREMGLSGIGVLLRPDERSEISLIHIENCCITENNIMYCFQQEIDENERFFLTDQLPISAISLAFCEDCIIRENWLEENGKQQLQPVCGIFVLFTEKIDISNNRVINNGPDVQRINRSNLNVRAGILIFLAFKLPQLNNATTRVQATNNTSNSLLATNNLYPAFDSVPAAKVHDNIVSQPLGLAFFLIAIGPISVVSNQFCSQGINRNEIFSTLAGTVFILNLGLSKDLPGIFTVSLINWKYVNPSMAVGSSARASTSPASVIYRFWPSGKTMYTANQAMLDLRSVGIERCLSSQLILSLDDIAFVSNQSECAGFVGVATPSPNLQLDTVICNTFLFSISTRCNDNRFTDGFTATKFSLVSLALLNTAMGNQATHCLIVPFWIFRRKALNILLDVFECEKDKLELELNRELNFGDPRFNVGTF